MAKLTVRDWEVRGKRVLIRADFNVPLDENLEVRDDTRIRESLPTINYCLAQGAKVVVLMSHLGRPKGKVLPEYSLKPVAKRLEQFLNRKVIMAKDCVGEEVENLVNTASGGEVILLENLRFHLEEEKNEESFAQKLAQLGDVLVNDAFGTAHRNHSSNVGVAKFLPAVAGFLLEKEIKYLDEAINNPTPPFTAILGGAKISGKIEIIENLLDKVDHLLIGGAMAFTFLKAQGKEVGKSKIEPDKIELASKTLALAKKRKVDFILPLDHLTVTEIKEEAEVKVEENISPDRVAVDIGPKTIKKFEEVLRESKTVVWNGPMGIFEMAPFKRGTEKIAAILSQLPATTIIGGGDSVAAVNQAGYADKITHISTGGGASLEFLEGKTLPGIAALKEK